MQLSTMTSGELPATGNRIFIIGVALALTVASASLAVERGRISTTALSVCAMRAIGANDPDPKVRNPDHPAEKILGQAYWRQSTFNYYLEE